MSYPIGIDLGTTNSVVCVWRRGAVETILVEGRSTLPSAISIRPDGGVLVGQAAKSRALIEPAQSITSAKRFIGDGKTVWLIGSSSYTPVDVSALILGRLKAAAEAHLGEAVTEAVITVPAYFNNNQKEATKKAGEQAGLKVLQLLPEPTAAAISYGLDKGRDQTILVYDLGGGTFDVSILKVKGNQFDVVAVDGDSHLGGDDFDLRIVEHLLGLLQHHVPVDGEILKGLQKWIRGGREYGASNEIFQARQKLKEAAERAKIELSESDTSHITLPEILGTALDEEITLATYNRLIGPLVEQTLSKIRSVLQASRLSAEDMDRIILVGGSTKNRVVRRRVAEAIKEPYTAERVDEVVAQGAAILASALASPERDLTPIEIHNVTPHSLGVRATRDENRDHFEVLIPKNTPVPAEAVYQQFTTQADNQSKVDIAVFQGEGRNCRENTPIGAFQLTGIPPLPAGQPRISVSFRLDTSDLLTVRARCSDLRSERILNVNLVSRAYEEPPTPQADILFLIDTSRSMTDELEGVKRSCWTFADRIVRQGVDCRLGLVDFDLPFGGSYYNWEVFPLTEPRLFPASIARLEIGRLGGHGCYIGEQATLPVVEAFIRAFPPLERRLRIGILISDEVGNDMAVIERTAVMLRDANICLHVVGVARSAHDLLARITGGKFWDILQSRGQVDFSQILDAIALEITNLALSR